MARPWDAWLRGGAGPHHDRRASRGGARNDSRDWVYEAAEESRPQDAEDNRGAGGSTGYGDSTPVGIGDKSTF